VKSVVDVGEEVILHCGIENIAVSEVCHQAQYWVGRKTFFDLHRTAHSYLL
jgi:hypothetical protein